MLVIPDHIILDLIDACQPYTIDDWRSDIQLASSFAM